MSRIVLKFGHNEDIDIASTPEDIWSTGGVYVFPTSADVLHIVSSSVTDDQAQTGARTIRIWGLDENFFIVSLDIFMLGTVAITTTQTFMRVLRARVLTAGTNETNAGTITIRHTDASGDILATVEPDIGSSLLAIYTIPAEMRKSHFVSWKLSGSFPSNGAAELLLQSRPNGGAWVTQDAVHLRQPGAAIYQRSYAAGIQLDEITDIRIRVIETDIDNLEMHASFEVQVEHEQRHCGETH